MKPATTRLFIFFMASALALAACGVVGGSSQQQPAVQLEADSTATVGPATQVAGAAVGTATPSVEQTATPATATPGGAANAEITPNEVTVGGVTLSLALQTARPFFDEASIAGAGANPDPAQQPQGKSKEPKKGSVVFGQGMLRTSNNFDPSQNPPADSPEAILRHVVLEVKSKAGGQVVPYLDVTMDVLFDGRPTIFDLGLVPMAALDGNSAQIYYGNNVKFPRKGNYQIFIRMRPSPLLGQEQPPAAQFNLTFR